MRVEQREGAHGSLGWIQRLVDRKPDLLDHALRSAGALSPDATLEWISPRRADQWAEYRDEELLHALGRPELGERLRAFWPRGGPQWDGVARAGETVFLVEAKAHLEELKSACQAGETSREMIARALERTRTSLNARPGADWLSGYYQYANRLAHLHFFREAQVNAYLVFLYFLNDARMGGPSSRSVWEAALQPVYRDLGIDQCQPIPGVVNVFVDVADLA